MGEERRFDAVVVGGGVAGMSTAARLQAEGLTTAVLEQHDHVGGCAGYYRTDGFAFDVGATTLVDFEQPGVGWQLLNEAGFDPPEMTVQDAYAVHLPDRTVRLYRAQERWDAERREKLGSKSRHLAFYDFVDALSAAFWEIARADVKLPIQGVGDVVRNVRAVGLTDLPLLRYLRWTVADALERYGVAGDLPLRKTIAALVEDTVHSTLDEAPLPNAVLGMTIRRAGLGRATGGMYGFWSSFERQYVERGGRVETGQAVTGIRGARGDFRIRTTDGEYRAGQVVSAVPVEATRDIAPSVVGDRLDDCAAMVRANEGGAIVVFLGVPEAEVDGREITHHQIVTDYEAPLGNGNNMFVSVSAPGDDVSAPPGHRAVMLSTHCDIDPWQGLDPETHEERKRAAGEDLIERARTVYPDLATDPAVYEVGTPVTYESFTDRPRGAIGGYRQTLANANQHAVPQDVGVDGFYLAGDTTWPGLGTVACVRGSAIATECVLRDR